MKIRQCEICGYKGIDVSYCHLGNLVCPECETETINEYYKEKNTLLVKNLKSICKLTKGI